ncbi:mechanosensitive ion channel protein [Salipaludibacillus neizhouensis]|uniref:Mechanosensitive ion channel protein n=1 Tax=Salipaludibacillus neizhouensis TaxID=885475 RepID=A0A3A9KW63_9BACI|nr:mechanosensitive ion channel family protein [Salipaludibacillus neizhouensis]RKL68846.1 mechanosensitive ion channel protein [Salipaludibacillus neizhouensis]
MNYWFLALTWQEISIAIGIFFLFLLFRKLFTTYIFKLILAFSKKAPTDILTSGLLAFERPLRSFFVAIGLFTAFYYLPTPETFDVTIYRIFRTLIIGHIAWGIYNISASSSTIFTRVGTRLDIKFDQIVLPFLSKLIRFAVIAMAISIIADVWDFNVDGFVAGLGLGGLAFALAAQESLGNFFGGVIIITEKPFTLGDWISTPTVEGIVEDINFRSTSIRTFADTIIVIPNSTLANEAIQNWSSMRKRQVSFDLGIKYSTPRNKVKRCTERIDNLLKVRDDIDQETIIVRFNEFNDSSLDIMIYFFTKTTAWLEHMEVKENINLEIMAILEDEGVSVAFPSRSIYMESENNKDEEENQM